MRMVLASLVLFAPAAAGAQSYYPSPAVSPDGVSDVPAWREPAPYRREDQVDEGTPNDAAHRADRAYTARLNASNSRPGWNEPAAPSRADAAAYARNIRQYEQARAEYAQEMATWRSSVGYYR